MLRVEGRDLPIFEILPQEGDSPSADNHVRYDNNARGRNKPVESVAADRSVLSQYSRFALNNNKLSETLALIDAVSTRLESPRVFDPSPKLMRGYERRTETQLARNGYNISPVLLDLWIEKRVLEQVRPTPRPTANAPKDASGKALKQILKMKIASGRDTLQRILKRIAQFPDEPFSDFHFIRTSKTGDVMFAFKSAANTDQGEIIDARLVSDGTLRALAILTALEISPEGSRLILEELDNGVHPSRVPILVEALFDCANRNRLHVLATTHNPATMNALNQEQLNAVLLVVSGGEGSGSRLVRLHELPGYVEFIEQGRLGDLVTRRVYEQHLRPDYEEGRKAEIESWVNNLP
jgi:hypothetical protein